MLQKLSNKMLNSRISGWKNSVFVRVLLFVALAIFFYVTLSGELISPTYDIERGSTSDRDIRATKQIANQNATDKAKKQAAAQVQDVYSVMSLSNMELLDLTFDMLSQINADKEFTSSEKVNIYKGFFAQVYTDTVNSAIDRIEDNDNLKLEIQSQLNEQQYAIPEEVYFKFPRLSLDEIEAMRPVAKQIVSKLMSNASTNADLARSKVAEQVNASQLTQKNARELVQEVARFAITPNKFYDEKATKLAKEEAEDSVQMVFIQEGDLIVAKNQQISDEVYQILFDLNLLKDKINYWPQLGLIMLIFLFLLLLYLFIRQSDLPIRQNNAQLIMLILIFFLNISAMKIVELGLSNDLPNIGYLAPVAMGSILIAILLGHSLAFISSVLFSIFASIIFNMETGQMIFDYRFGFVTVIVCFVSVFVIHKASQRSTILRAGLLVSIFASAALASIILLGENPKFDFTSFAFTIASGLITAVLVIGLLPFFEVSFGILSSLKLVELSNPNHPLLRKLLTETPGTYHHSVMVGNLSEAAAEAIGANGLLCRVGSFYHDIGKTKRPSYFIENQGNIENPHDQIDPFLSKSIIIAHARDGVDMLKDYKMPKQLRDIAEQHHGTSLLTYFYHKALKQTETEQGAKEEIEESEFRYPGPKAQTKETAIVGIADCVEAAVRSLRNPTMQQIDSMVDKIIKNRLEDGQFNECDITLKDLDVVGKTLKETLLGIFHSRIEYPELPNKNEVKESRT